MAITANIKAPTGSATKVSTGSAKKDAFFNRVLNPVIAESKKSGIPASIILAQMIEESSWGTSTLTKYNNFWGIKAGSSWDGPTSEPLYDKMEKSYAKYRAYDSMAEGLADHNKVLHNKRYQSALAQPTIEGKVRGIHKAGYATNPNYSNNLMAIIRDNNLTQYDDPNAVPASFFAEDPGDSFNPLPGNDGDDATQTEMLPTYSAKQILSVIIYVLLGITAIVVLLLAIPKDNKGGSPT